MENLFVGIGSLFGALGVALGAFGTHALRSRLTKERQEVFETGVRYQMYHALALLGLGFGGAGTPLQQLAGWLFFAGVVLFSGSLYVMVGSGNRQWGTITPIGGVALVAGWVCLLLAVL